MKAFVRSLVPGIACIGLFMPGAALAQATDIAAKAAIFGARPRVLSVSLSPDGQQIAVIQPTAGQGAAVLVAATENSAGFRPIFRASGNPERLDWCRWTSNARLLCSVYGAAQLDSNAANRLPVYFSRLVAIDADGSHMQELRTNRTNGDTLGYTLYGGSVVDWNPGQDGHFMMLSPYVPERDIGTRLAQTKRGLALEDIDSANLRRRTIESPDETVSGYITDGIGHARIRYVRQQRTAQGYASPFVKYLYRLQGERNWRDLGTVNSQERTGFFPLAVDPTANIAYGLEKLDGRFAAYSLSLDGSMTKTLIYANPQVDVHGFVQIGRSQRVIGISYVTDARYVKYTDPVYDRLAASLARALPNLPQIDFIDASQDENRLLLRASSDVDPGRYYVFDRTTHSLNEVMLAQPELEGVQLAPQQAITYTASDGTQIPGYLTMPPGREAAKGLPAIVMPHGGPSARDEWGYDWLVQFWASLGYAVLQPNYRGSDGYGEQWFEDQGFRQWRLAIGDVNDAGKWLVDQGIADPNKLAIFGWSYGGYAALQSAVVDPARFKAIVAVAPVTDLQRLKNDQAFYGDEFLVRDFVGSGPEVLAGSPLKHAGQILAPVLLFHGTLDSNVSVDHSRAMDSELHQAGRRSQLVIYENMDHYLEDSAIRRDMLTRSAEFLAARLGH